MSIRALLITSHPQLEARDEIALAPARQQHKSSIQSSNILKPLPCGPGTLNSFFHGSGVVVSAGEIRISCLNAA